MITSSQRSVLTDGDDQFRQVFESIIENRQERRKNHLKINANDDVYGGYALAA